MNKAAAQINIDAIFGIVPLFDLIHDAAVDEAEFHKQIPLHSF